MRQWLLGLLGLAAVAIPAHSASSQGLEELNQSRDVFQKAREARQRDDIAGYLKLMQEAHRLRPEQPGAAFRLAGALAKSGQADAAAKLLARVAKQGVYFDAANDADFVSVREHPAIQAAVSALNENLRPVVKSQTAFTLDESTFLPEGIAHDPETGAFYLASVHQRKIVMRLATGEVKPFGQAAEPALWSVLAIKVDAKRRHLWATTAAVEQTARLDPALRGRTAVVQFDLKTGKQLARFDAPDDGKPRVFGDLVVTTSGKVYIAEAEQGALWRIANQRLEPFVKPGKLASPQGLAFPDQAQWLYVADYSLGLLRVDVASRKIEKVSAPDSACLLGIDGLVRQGNRLIAVQNGLRPNRVIRIDLDADGQASRVVVLEANHPGHAEPTLGTVVGNDLYYVANAQWDQFPKGVPGQSVKPPLILRLPIDPGR